MTILKAEKRSKDVKAKRLRREGYVTGNIFGREMKESVMVKMNKKELERALKTRGEASKILLEVEGKSYNVLIKEIDYDSLKKQINEIDFQELVSGEKVHSTAKVIPLNHENVVDGAFQLLLEEIAYKAYPDALVEKVEFDAGSMHAGDSIKVKDLDIAKDQEVELITDPEATVAVVSELKNAAAEEQEEGTEQ